MVIRLAGVYRRAQGCIAVMCTLAGLAAVLFCFCPAVPSAKGPGPIINLTFKLMLMLLWLMVMHLRWACMARPGSSQAWHVTTCCHQGWPPSTPGCARPGWRCCCR
jgi:hypothetical protein